jgi:pyruvate/2-oxoglutarate dehydrogenase complex dihydrolipoamide dehydrogenase (E3) component
VRGPALAHKASDEGIIAVEDAAGMETHPIEYIDIPRRRSARPTSARSGSPRSRRASRASTSRSARSTTARSAPARSTATAAA